MNPYTFDRFLAWRSGVDFYADDPFLVQLIRHHAGPDFPRVDGEARTLSRRASSRWREASDAIAVLEARPRLQHWDAHHRRVDRVVRPAEALELEREVFAEGLFSARTDLLTRAVKQFIVYQNGEACIACPLVCTEGLVAALDELADRPETVAMRDHLKEGRDGRHAVGAQFLTEIQGGSDVPANRVEAVRDGDRYRISGTKFFCSVAHADYAAITARESSTGALGLFAMPLWTPGREETARNGLTVDRLKWKTGTCELPTAEMTFDGAEAWALGPVERGLANVVRIVLTVSRLTIGLASAAYATRAVREARAYASFREAFGRPVDGFPMVRAQLEDLERSVQRAAAGAFEVHRLHRLAGERPAARIRGAGARDAPEGGGVGGRDPDHPGGHGTPRWKRRGGGLLLASTPLPRLGGERALGGPAQRAARAGAPRPPARLVLVSPGGAGDEPARREGGRRGPRAEGRGGGPRRRARPGRGAARGRGILPPMGRRLPGPPPCLPGRGTRARGRRVNRGDPYLRGSGAPLHPETSVPGGAVRTHQSTMRGSSRSV